MTIPTIVGTPPYQNKSTGTMSLAGPVCQAGDLVFVFVMCIQTESLLTTTGQSPPYIAATDSPYTQVAGSPWSDATSNKKLYLFWARATGASIPAAQTSDPTTLVQYCVIVVRGGLTTNPPYEQLTGGTDTTADTTTTIPGITTQGPDRLVIGGVTTNFDGTAAQWSAWTNANLDLTAPLGEQGDQCTNTGSGTVPGGLGAYAGGKAAQGATGNTTATLANASRNVYAHFAVIPAPSAKNIQIASAITETDALYAVKVNPLHRLVKLISETNTVYLLKRIKTRALGVITETDARYSITPRKIKCVVLNTISETDGLYGLKRIKSRTFGGISESDSCYVLTRIKSRAFGTVTETETLYSITPKKSKNVLLNTISETNTVSAITSHKSHVFGTLTETDAVNTITLQRSILFGVISETDLLYAFTGPSTSGSLIITDLGNGDWSAVDEPNFYIDLIDPGTFEITHPNVVYLDSDTFEISSSAKVSILGILIETDGLYALGSVKTKILGTITEPESLYSITPKKRKSVLLNAISETDTVSTIIHHKSHTFGTLTETESLYSITPKKSVLFNTISETNTISTINHYKSRTLGILTETNTVSTITRHKSHAFGALTETDSIYAFTINPKRRLLHTIIESDSLGAISIPGQKKINVGLVTETNTIHSVKVNPKHKLLGTIAETEIIYGIHPHKFYALGTIAETDTIQVIKVNPQCRLLGTITETDNVYVISHLGQKVVSVNTITETDIIFAITLGGQPEPQSADGKFFAFL